MQFLIFIHQFSQLYLHFLSHLVDLQPLDDLYFCLLPLKLTVELPADATRVQSGHLVLLEFSL